MTAPREIPPPPAPRTRFGLALWAALAAREFAERGSVIRASIEHDDDCDILRGGSVCLCNPILVLTRGTSPTPVAQ